MERIEKAEVKFYVHFTGWPVPDLPDAEHLARWCGIFHEKGLAPSYGEGSSGNLSFRVAPGKNEFLITASRLPLKNALRLTDFVLIHRFDRTAFSAKVSGEKKPSSESALHAAIYEARQDVNAIFHGHSPEILKSADRLRLLQTEKEEEYGRLAVVDAVMAVLGTHTFIVMKNHGFVSLGKSMDEAGTQALDVQSRA